MPWFVLRRVVRKKNVKRAVRRRRPRARTAASKQGHALFSKEAHALAHARLEHFNQHYGYVYKKIIIRNTRTRWGTCSSKGNISFNWRIVTLPPELQDYVIVHELCHLRQLNHSAAFWALVAETIPDWKVRRKALMKIPIKP